MTKLKNNELSNIILKAAKNDVIDLPLWKRNWHQMDSDNYKKDSDYDR